MHAWSPKDCSNRRPPGKKKWIAECGYRPPNSTSEKGRLHSIACNRLWYDQALIRLLSGNQATLFPAVSRTRKNANPVAVASGRHSGTLSGSPWTDRRCSLSDEHVVKDGVVGGLPRQSSGPPERRGNAAKLLGPVGQSGSGKSMLEILGILLITGVTLEARARGVHSLQRSRSHAIAGEGTPPDPRQRDWSSAAESDDRAQPGAANRHPIGRGLELVLCWRPPGAASFCGEVLESVSLLAIAVPA